MSNELEIFKLFKDSLTFPCLFIVFNKIPIWPFRRSILEFLNPLLKKLLGDTYILNRMQHELGKYRRFCLLMDEILKTMTLHPFLKCGSNVVYEFEAYPRSTHCLIKKLQSRLLFSIQGLHSSNTSELENQTARRNWVCWDDF